MTGAENYKEAERLIKLAHGQETGVAAVTFAAAQVHATLALAAATAMASRLNDSLSGWVVGMDTPDQKAWDKVAGEGR